MTDRHIGYIDDLKQATGTPESNREIIDWTRGSKNIAYMDTNADGEKQLSINAIDGTHWVFPGDFIQKLSEDTFALHPRKSIEKWQGQMDRG